MIEEGYETIYYLQTKDGRRKFAVIKFYPQVIQHLAFKTIKSGEFQFAISDETRLKEFVEKAEERLKDVVRVTNIRAKVLNIFYDLIAEILIDGLTFELSVEEALYLASLLVKFVEEDYDIIREMRLNLMAFEENDRDDPSVS